MLLTLAKHQTSRFLFLFTSDESWMFYFYHREAMWVPSWSEVDDIERPSYFGRKTIIAVFFNGTR
jgi:hypothetical protein